MCSRAVYAPDISPQLINSFDEMEKFFKVHITFCRAVPRRELGRERFEFFGAKQVRGQLQPVALRENAAVVYRQCAGYI